MKLHLLPLLAIAPLTCFPGCGGQQDADLTVLSESPQNASLAELPRRSRFLVDRDELEQLLAANQVVVLDTRPHDEYRHSHVPGAIRVDAGTWARQAHAEGGLSDSDWWSQAIGELGISDAATVVVYGGKSPTSPARVWWHLKYAGVDDVRLLDGGWTLWKVGGKQTANEIPEVAPAQFQADFDTSLLVEAEQLLGDPEVGQKVDARSTDEFRGRGPGETIGGHLPGAVHLEWKELLDGSMRFKSDEKLRALCKEHGLDPEQPIITYCRSGGRASVNAFVLQMIGCGNVKNFYGGWSQWSQLEDAPVEK